MHRDNNQPLLRLFEPYWNLGAWLSRLEHMKKVYQFWLLHGSWTLFDSPFIINNDDKNNDDDSLLKPYKLFLVIFHCEV